MARRGLSALLVPAFAGLLWSAQAKAEPTAFGEDHPLVLSLEHLGGASYIHFEPDGGRATNIYQFGLFTPLIAPETPQARLGLHYFVTPQVSLGALFGYVDNDQLGTSELVGARVGYSLALSKSNALWLRGGVAYTHTKFSALGTITITNIVPGAEALFVLRPVENFGILLGPMFEIGVNGKEKTDFGVFSSSGSSETSFKYYEVGLSVGVLADF